MLKWECTHAMAPKNNADWDRCWSYNGGRSKARWNWRLRKAMSGFGFLSLLLHTNSGSTGYLSGRGIAWNSRWDTLKGSNRRRNNSGERGCSSRIDRGDNGYWCRDRCDCCQWDAGYMRRSANFIDLDKVCARFKNEVYWTYLAGSCSDHATPHTQSEVNDHDISDCRLYFNHERWHNQTWQTLTEWYPPHPTRGFPLLPRQDCGYAPAMRTGPWAHQGWPQAPQSSWGTLGIYAQGYHNVMKCNVFSALTHKAWHYIICRW